MKILVYPLDELDSDGTQARVSRPIERGELGEAFLEVTQKLSLDQAALKEIVIKAKKVFS